MEGQGTRTRARRAPWPTRTRGSPPGQPQTDREADTKGRRRAHSSLRCAALLGVTYASVTISGRGLRAERPWLARAQAPARCTSHVACRAFQLIVDVPALALVEARAPLAERAPYLLLAGLGVGRGGRGAPRPPPPPPGAGPPARHPDSARGRGGRGGARRAAATRAPAVRAGPPAAGGPRPAAPLAPPPVAPARARPPPRPDRGRGRVRRGVSGDDSSVVRHLPGVAARVAPLHAAV